MTRVSDERQHLAVQLVVAARRQDALFHIEGYCDGTRCPARDVRLCLKDYADEAIALIARHGLTCPLCGAALKVHGVWTRNEQHRHAETRARMSALTEPSNDPIHSRTTGTSCWRTSVTRTS